MILENGVPTDDTFQRIFAIIKPEQLEKCFVNWMKSVNDISKNEIINIDGKTICGSRDDNYSVIHMISAWANKTGIVLRSNNFKAKKSTFCGYKSTRHFKDFTVTDKQPFKRNIIQRNNTSGYTGVDFEKMR